MKKITVTILLILCALCMCACGDYAIPQKNLSDYSEYLNKTAEYTHDTASFTEGLFCLDGRLYESTGRKGHSKLLKNISLETGMPQMSTKLDASVFGEGCAYYNGSIYVLSYEQNVAFTFDAESLELTGELTYEREGWGLTTDGTYLIASDGSSKIFFMDGELNTERTIDVTFNSHKINNLNELEYINGKIWANVWLKDYVVIIDPETGKVEGAISFAALVPDEAELKSSDSVLNGIAYDGEANKLYLTGKNWPVMYEFELK